MTNTINAKITSTKLGIEDHGIMTFNLQLDYGGSGQGAGGYALCRYDKGLQKRVGTADGMDLIMRIMEVVGVEKWEDLAGKLIRVKQEHTKVHAVGNILSEEWLNFEEFFQYRRETQ